jgi:hypothetical protein
MHHIFWSGKGFLVAVFTFGFSLIANLTTNSVTGSAVYWDTHKWPVAVSLFAAAVPCWFVGRHLKREVPRVLIDPRTGETVILRKSHTLFFIPVIWWAPLLAVFGVVVLGAEFMK